MCTLLQVIVLFNMLVHLFTVLSFNCAFFLTEVGKRLYHNASQLKSMITFRREIVSQVVGYEYISQTRSIYDFYCQRSSVCPYVVLCSIPGAGLCVVFGNEPLSVAQSLNLRMWQQFLSTA